MNKHVVVDGRQHPGAARILTYLDTMPAIITRQHTKARTLHILQLHLLYGSEWAGKLSARMEMWAEMAKRRVRLGKASEHLVQYWAIMDDILAQPAEPLPLEIEPVKKPEPLSVPKRRKARDRGLPQPRWKLAQHHKLMMLDTLGIRHGDDDDHATTVWWHFLFKLRDCYTAGWRMDVDGCDGLEPYLRIFVEMQPRLLDSGVLTKDQDCMVRELLSLPAVVE